MNSGAYKMGSVARRCFRNVRMGSALVAALLSLVATTVSQAQVTYPLGSTGTMGLGNPNGDFTVAQDDMSVKVPGGYVRINRDFDGTQWVFNRQWSGLGDPSFNQNSYASLGTFRSCTIIDGISSCDSTASAGVPTGIRTFVEITQTRVPNDPQFGRLPDGSPLPGANNAQFLARKGVGFTRSTDGTSYVSSKYPRFLVRPQLVSVLPASAGADSHPGTGRPGQGGVATTQVNGFRWTDRSGAWIEYDNFGRIASYGDRNDVRVWFQYANHGQIERILDDNGRTVFTFLYSGNGSFITEARDHTPLDGNLRRVAYHYDSVGRLDRVTDARGHDTSYDYHAGGGENAYKISKVTDAEGRVLGIEYGATGRIEKLTGPDGARTNIEYGYDKLKKEFSTVVRYPETATGRKTEIKHYDIEGRLVYSEVTGKPVLTTKGLRRSMTYTDANNNSVSITRDGYDQVTQKTNSDGTSSKLTYESGSLDLKEVVDEAGVATNLAYDGKGNLTTLKAATGKPEEQTTEYEVNARGEAELVRRKGGANANGTTDPDVEVQLEYDANGNVRELVDGEGKTWRYEYDGQGNLTKSTDPLSHEWSYTYDAHGNVLTETDANLLVTSFLYDKTDLLLSSTDSRGKVYAYQYDEAGRLKKFTDSTSAIIAYEYDQAGRKVGSYNSLDQRVGYSYDNLDRVISQTDGQGNVTQFEYTDVDGVDRGSHQITKISYPTLQRLLRYNARRGLTQVIEVLDNSSRTISASYDTRGLLGSVTDPYGKEKNITHDALGRKAIEVDRSGHATHFDYDHRDNLIQVTDELGHKTRLQYDRRDKLVKEVNAVGQETIYKYDDAGRIQEILRANGTKLIFEFDAGGRLHTRKSYRDSGDLELTDTFTWDNGNRLTDWSTGSASSTSIFDEANRLLSETVTIDGIALTRSYTYYPNGQIKTYTGQNGVTVTYAYDGNGELSRVDIPAEGSISVTERQWTEAKKVVLPGGTVQEIERNGLLSPIRLRVKGPNQTVLFDQQSSYGKLEEVTSRTTQGMRVDYAYDDATHLLEADPSSGEAEIFELDAVGNRLSDNAVSSAWQYDDANRLTQRGHVNYQYDAAGNLVRKIDTTLAEPRRTTHYSYDGYNRMVEVRDGADQVVSRYTYDPFGYRLSKEVTATGATNTGAPVGKRLFLQGEEGLLAEISAAGAVLQSYGWHPDGTYSTSPLFLHADNVYYYFHNDMMGVPWRLTNKEGAVVWSAASTHAFGKIELDSSNVVQHQLRYPGQYHDAETGLDYNLRRYYDSSLGRYTTEDPIGIEGGLNLYIYAEASPTYFIDPYGEKGSQQNQGQKPRGSSGNFSPGGGGNAQQRRAATRNFLRNGATDTDFDGGFADPEYKPQPGDVPDYAPGYDRVCTKVRCYRRANPLQCSMGDGWYTQDFMPFAPFVAEVYSGQQAMNNCICAKSMTWDEYYSRHRQRIDTHRKDTNQLIDQKETDFENLAEGVAETLNARREMQELNQRVIRTNVTSPARNSQRPGR